jgi:hypothetical protein
MKRIILISVFSLFIVISCGRKEFTEAGINEIVAEYDKILEKATDGKRFDWGDAKAYSNFTAYFHESKLIFINEDYTHRIPIEAFNRYYFKDGNLVYFIGKEFDANTKKRTELTLYIDPNGNVIRYDKIAGGERIELESEESDFIINHADELYKVVDFKTSSVK